MIMDIEIAWIEGGNSHIGTSRPEIQTDGEHPVRSTVLRPYGIGKFAVSNREFSKFIDETAYVTDSERLGWSFVFRGLQSDDTENVAPNLPWWHAVDGACWKEPTGPRSNLVGFADHPVVHVSQFDATQFARWVGGRLPTESEWEHAARGGAHEARYPWGDDEPDDEDKIYCNIWQGAFPESNTEADGYYGTSPVGSFEPNRFGIYNMSGNVWEWCADRYKVRSLSRLAKSRNLQANNNNEYVLKGGSFLCHRSSCWRYRIAARSGQQADNATSNAGFRVAFDRDRTVLANAHSDVSR